MIDRQQSICLSLRIIYIGDQVNCSVTESNGNVWIGTLDGVSLYTPIETTILENKKANTILVFPNPANDVVKINVDDEMLGLNYKITNDIGRIVLSGQINFTENEIKIDGFVPGIYFLQITGNKGQIVKIVKQ